jgi:hypothetical protein
MEVLEVLYSPATAFTRLREKKAAWVLAVMVLMAITLLFMVLLLSRFSVEEITEVQMAASGREMPPGSMEQALPFITMTMYVMPLISVPILTLLLSVVLLVIVKAYGGETTFVRMLNAGSFAMVGWSIVNTTLTVIMLYASLDLQTFNLNNPVPLNLGYFFEPDSVGKAVSAFLSGINFVNFYFIWLLSLATAKLSDRVKQGSVMVALVGIYVVYVLIKTGAATVMG